METTTAMVGGGVLVLFGGALLLWCAAEVRLRHLVRRRGVPAVARVVGESDAYGELDSAPLLSFAVAGPTGGIGRGPVGGPVGGPIGGSGAGPGEVVLARPRGHTPLRRPAGSAPGATVRVRYDPRRPSRVVLAEGESDGVVLADLLWAALGAGSLAGGLCLLAAAL